MVIFFFFFLQNRVFILEDAKQELLCEITIKGFSKVGITFIRATTCSFRAQCHHFVGGVTTEGQDFNF